MEVLIIPDVHGRDFWKNPVNDLQYDKAIFLGDYVDHYEGESNAAHDILILEDIIKLKKSDPDKYILLLGNHDLPYIWPDSYGKALGSYWCRHNSFNHDEIHDLFVDNLDLFTFAWECDNMVYGKVLFTHAGVTNIYKDVCGLSALKINKFFKDKTGDIPNVVGLASVSHYRGGYQDTGSIVWADIREHIYNPVEEVFQIFGHTYSKKEIITANFAMLDTGKDCWMLTDKGLNKV